jgi:CRP/FNR family transcriptional regulator
MAARLDGAHRLGEAPAAPPPPHARPADLIALLGGLEASDAALDLNLSLREVQPGECLVHQDSLAQVCFVVRHGCLKLGTTQQDGYEQILSVAFVGDVLGFETLDRGRQPAEIVALNHGMVYVIPLADLLAAQQTCGALARAFNRALSRQLLLAAESAYLTAPVAAEARLARFLLWWSRRSSCQGARATRLELLLDRREVASLLGVAHETISRALGSLADAGIVTVNKRLVDILDPGRLRSRAGSTRHMGPGAAGAQGD